MSYYTPTGGLPPQTQLMSETDRAVVTEAYTFIPKGCNTDIVTMQLPGWDNTRVWVLARPIDGFATTFSQYMLELGPGGGSQNPNMDANEDASMEHALFITGGSLTLTINDASHTIKPGHFAYIPAGAQWTIKNTSTTDVASLHWIRRRYQPVAGLDTPAPIVTHETDANLVSMPGTDGTWQTTRFVDPDDVRHDMHITIVTLAPGAVIPFSRNPRDGARVVCIAWQGRLPAE